MKPVDPAAVRRVLALVPNWLGDVAMCTPALRALHNRFPLATLTVAGRASACDLLKGLAYVHRRVPIPAKPAFSAMRGIAADLSTPDVIVVFPHSFRAAALARLAGGRIRVGYRRNGRALFLTHAVTPHRKEGKIEPIYMANEYLDLVRALGCEDDGKGLELAADAAAVAEVNNALPARRPRIGIAPGAAFGPSKRWLPERYAAVADALVEKTGAACVLITGPGEEDTREAVQKAARHPLHVADKGKPTIDSLKATIAGLDLLIGNDSGPRHVAIAFGVPVVCIMGSTSPKYSVGPYEKGEVLRIDVDCGPCQKPVCVTDHRCMTGIEAARVVEAALRNLGVKA